MEEEHDGHETHDDHFFQQIPLKGFNRRSDQSRTVIARHDFHAVWKRRLDCLKFFLYSIDYLQSVHAIAHHNDSADGFALAIPFGSSLTDVRAERYGSEITNENRSAVLRRHGHRLKIVNRAQIAETANHVLRSTHFEHTPTDFVCAVANLVDHHRERDVVGAQLIRIKVDLILADEASNRGDFRNPRNSL